MFELVRKNRTRSTILVILMTIFLVMVGAVAGELLQPGMAPIGIVGALILSSGLFLVSFYSGDSLLLRAAGANPIEKEDAPQLYNVVEEMVIASALGSMPNIYVIESPAANAFATGRKPEVSSVAVTEGLLNILDRDELQAVIAHEVAHIKNRDILYMTLLAVMAGSISMIADMVMRHFRFFGGGRRSSRSSDSSGGGQAQAVIMLVGLVLIVVGAVTARLVYFAASRSREYLADASGAIFTRNPEALASALEKISSNVQAQTLPLPKVAQAMLIVGANFFSTHPPVQDRIGVLRKLAGLPQVSYKSYARGYSQVLGKQASFMPKSAFVQDAGMAAVPHREGATGALRREAIDAVKKKAGYSVYPCACGATTKVPPEFPRERQILCHACGATVR